jgi:hypothetical protein
MPAIGDLVHQNSASTGTGNLTLSAINGKRTFDSVFGHAATTNFFHYFISNRNAAEWEYGTGHMSDATTLVRDTVILSSNANAAVSFSAGTLDVASDLPASMQDIHAATGKTTPDDSDEIGLLDSAASYVLKKLTWANAKATLKTYFDTLYAVIDAALTSLAGVSWVQGDLGYWSGTDTAARLAKDTNATRYLSNQGTSNNPSWNQVNLTNGVTGTLPAGNLPAATTSAQGISEFATAAEYRTGTDTGRSLVVSEVWAAALAATLTDGANIAVDLSAGINFGGSTTAKLSLGGNRSLSAPSNAKGGQSGVLWFGASSSTRTLTLNAAWVLLDGVEVGPYSITTSQTLGVAYVVLGTTIYVTAILRTG